MFWCEGVERDLIWTELRTDKFGRGRSVRTLVLETFALFQHNLCLGFPLSIPSSHQPVRLPWMLLMLHSRPVDNCLSLLGCFTAVDDSDVSIYCHLLDSQVQYLRICLNFSSYFRWKQVQIHKTGWSLTLTFQFLVKAMSIAVHKTNNTTCFVGLLWGFTGKKMLVRHLV